MASLNKWLEPYRRSFDAIKGKLLNDLDTITDNEGKPLITDKSEGNILVLILSMFSAIAEVLHFYIDNVARETFLPSARKYESLIKHAKLVDYHLKGAFAPRVTVRLSRQNTGVGITISSNEDIKDSKGNNWQPARDYFWTHNSSQKSITLIQHRPIEDNSYSTDNIINDRYIVVNTIPNGELYEEGTMQLKIGEEEYGLVETFAKSSPEDKHFMVEISNASNSSSLLIVFGDGINGYKPSQGGNPIILNFYVTKGESGVIGKNGIQGTWPNNFDIQVNNTQASTSGSDYEDFDTLKTRITNSVKTLDVAISKEDFRDLALTRPGVGQAAVEYECGRKLNIYIATPSGEVASEDLCEEVKEYINQHCPLTTWLDVKPVGITPITLAMDIVGKKSFKKDYIHDQVMEALNNRYSAGNTKINESIRLSDIYALIDGLESVDYLNITKFYLLPWPKILNGGKSLTITGYELIQCNTPQEYILVKTDGQWEVYAKRGGSGNIQSGKGDFNIVVNDTFHKNSFSLDLDNTDLIDTGSRYSMYVTLGNATNQDPGFNLPVIDESLITLNITETL